MMNGKGHALGYRGSASQSAQTASKMADAELQGSAACEAIKSVIDFTTVEEIRTMLFQMTLSDYRS